MRWAFCLILCCCSAWAAGPVKPPDVRHPLTTRLLHEQAQRVVPGSAALSAGKINIPFLPDAGNIAIVDGGEGVVLPAFAFDLDGQTLSITPVGPVATTYTTSVREGGFDNEAATSGQLVALGDDDSRFLQLPFPFPFFGTEYAALFLNSDGNLTFGQSDTATTGRDPARLVSLPRIAPYFGDLDPTQPGGAIRMRSAADRLTISWISVPEYRVAGLGPTQTFQVTLHTSGLIEFSYNGITGDTFFVGIAPGARISQSRAVDLSVTPEEPYTAAFVDIFLPADLDLGGLGLKFYANHEDAYDYLVIFQNYDFGLNTQAFAFYSGIRNLVQGIGPAPAGFEEFNLFDFGDVVGSGYRLQGLMYMGELSKYPDNPNGRLSPQFGLGLSTPLTVLAHETGHRFLVNTLFVDQADRTLSDELLGRQLSHWSFFYNSDASFLEGNRITDTGSGPFRFETVAVIDGYSALDMYLMGLIPPAEVPPSFFVRNPSIEGELFSRSHEPLAGVSFGGERVNVAIEDILGAHGRRTPDWTVSQKEFRYAFILLVEEGKEPSPAEIAKLERLRTEFELYIAQKTGGRAKAETELVKSLGLSIWPAVGVLEGGTTTGSVFLDDLTAEPLTVQLASDNDAIGVPAEVVIPAQTQFVEFEIEGLRPGVAALSATLNDTFETATARVQVQGPQRLSAARILLLEIFFGDPRERLRTGETGQPLPYPLLFQVTDENQLPYEGVTVRMEASGDGFADPAESATDELGFVSADWTLAKQRGLNTLRVTVVGSDQAPLEITAIGTIAPPRHRNTRNLIFGP